MNQINLKKLLEEEKISLPLYVLRIYNEFDLTTKELLLLFYLYNKNKVVFDPGIISNDLKMEVIDVMDNISNLSDKGLINVLTRKNEHGLMEEIVDLSPLLDKISLHIMDTLNTQEGNDLNLHHLIEEEFSRRLTPLEHEMIDDWKKNGYDSNLVKEAVKEASAHGVFNMRYIDAILLEWSKKGIKTVNEITSNNRETEKIEIMNYDWLDEDDEEI